MDAALYARLLAGAEAQYDDSYRTLVRDSKSGRLGLTGDYNGLHECLWQGREQKAKDPLGDFYVVAKVAGKVSLYELVCDELVRYEEPQVSVSRAPRTRPSGLSLA